MNKPTEREMQKAMRVFKDNIDGYLDSCCDAEDSYEMRCGIAQALADYRMELASLFEKDDVLCRDGFEDNIREAIENYGRSDETAEV